MSPLSSVYDYNLILDRQQSHSSTIASPLKMPESNRGTRVLLVSLLLYRP